MEAGKRREQGRRQRRPSPAGGPYWIYGSHAVLAALANRSREVLALRTTGEAAARLEPRIEAAMARRADAGRSIARAPLDPGALPPGIAPAAAHQGIAAEVRPLANRALEALAAGDSRLLVALDQVTDPQNVGSILRSCALLGGDGLVLTDRHAPPESGALAKAASGALEIVPVARVPNLARGLEVLKRQGFFAFGLDAAGPPANAAALPERVVLVAGAEGAGLRRLVRETCDGLIGLPVAPRAKEAGIDSFNVAVAAALALHALVARS